MQKCNNPYNIHGNAKIHIASRARPRGAIHLRAPPARWAGEETRWRPGECWEMAIRAARSGGGLAVRSNRMVNTSLACYCTPVAERWPGEIARQMKQPPCGTRRHRRISFPSSAERFTPGDRTTRESTLNVIRGSRVIAPTISRARFAFRSHTVGVLSQLYYNLRDDELQSTALL